MSDAPWLEIWTAVYAVATVGVLGALVFAGGTAWHQLRVSVLSALVDRWDSDLLRDARRLVNDASENLKQQLTQYEAENKAEYYTILALASFFEDLGILEKRSTLTIEEIADGFKASIKHYFGLFEDYINEAQTDDPSVLANFKELAGKV